MSRKMSPEQTNKIYDKLSRLYDETSQQLQTPTTSTNSIKQTPASKKSIPKSSSKPIGCESCQEKFSENVCIFQYQI